MLDSNKHDYPSDGAALGIILGAVGAYYISPKVANTLFQDLPKAVPYTAALLSAIILIAAGACIGYWAGRGIYKFAYLSESQTGNTTILYK